MSGEPPNASFQACQLCFISFRPLSFRSFNIFLPHKYENITSSDNDYSSQMEYGIPIGRRTSSSEVRPRPTAEVSESEAAKEVVKGSRCSLHF